jgi:hypothetical protein
VELTVDSPTGLGSRPGSNKDSRIRTLRKGNLTALKYIRANLPVLWHTFTAAVIRVANAARQSRDMEGLDDLVYGLRYVTHSLLQELRNREQATEIMEDMYLRDQLRAFRSGLGHTVMKDCTFVMRTHSDLYNAQFAKLSSSEVIRKYVSSYLLRRRLKLLARCSAWNKSGGQEHGAQDSTISKHPLLRIQAHIRGRLERIRLKELHAVEDAEETADIDRLERFDTTTSTIEYFDWPQVLTHYLKARPEIKSLRGAAMRILAMLKQLKKQADRNTGGEEDASDEEEEEDEEEDEDEEQTDFNASGITLPFPQILLDTRILQKKLDMLRNTLHNWVCDICMFIFVVVH